jgi:hypothetical protein
MSIEQAGTFLTGSILYALGFVIVFIAVVAINNILHKFWKPVKMFTPDSWKGFNPPAHEPTLSETK